MSAHDTGHALLLYRCLQSEDDELRTRTREAILAAGRLQEYLGSRADVALLVDTQCPAEVKTVEKLAKRETARITIPLEGLKVQSLLLKSLPEQVKCAGHLRNSFSIVRKHANRRKIKNVLSDDAYPLKVDGISQWFLSKHHEGESSQRPYVNSYSSYCLWFSSSPSVK